jgi:hypothetical protein
MASENGQPGEKPCDCAVLAFTSGKPPRSYWSVPTTCTCQTPASGQPRKCDGCKFGLFQDTGYSSYTVEGTDFFCLLNAHPDDGFDAWYREDGRLTFAAECPKFEAGEPISLDVEQEDMVDLTPEQTTLYKAWEASEVE